MQQARQMGTANGLEQRWFPRDVVPEGCGARGVEASGRADEIDAVDELRHAVLHLCGRADAQAQGAHASGAEA